MVRITKGNARRSLDQACQGIEDHYKECYDKDLDDYKSEVAHDMEKAGAENRQLEIEWAVQKAVQLSHAEWNTRYEEVISQKQGLQALLEEHATKNQGLQAGFEELLNTRMATLQINLQAQHNEANEANKAENQRVQEENQRVQEENQRVQEENQRVQEEQIIHLRTQLQADKDAKTAEINKAVGEAIETRDKQLQEIFVEEFEKRNKEWEAQWQAQQPEGGSAQILSLQEEVKSLKESRQADRDAKTAEINKAVGEAIEKREKEWEAQWQAQMDSREEEREKREKQLQELFVEELELRKKEWQAQLQTQQSEGGNARILSLQEEVKSLKDSREEEREKHKNRLEERLAETVKAFAEEREKLEKEMRLDSRLQLDAKLQKADEDKAAEKRQMAENFRVQSKRHADHIGTIEQEKKALMIKVEELERRNLNLKSENVSSKKQLEEGQLKIDTHKQELERERVQSKQKLEQSQRETCLEASEKLRQIEIVYRVEQHLEEVQEEKKQLKEAKQVAEDQVKGLEEVVRQAQRDEKHTQLRAEADSQAALIVELQSKLLALEEEIEMPQDGALEENMGSTGRDEERTKLRAEADSHLARIAQLQSNVQGLEDEIINLQKKAPEEKEVRAEADLGSRQITRPKNVRRSAARASLWTVAVLSLLMWVRHELIDIFLDPDAIFGLTEGLYG